MGRKVFISFLGTGTYKECRYVSKYKGESEVVKYVQTAISDLYCSDFTEDDIVYIFLTEGAKTKNWDSLKAELDIKGANYEPIYDLPNGYSEEEIWRIFDIVFSKLQNNDSVIFDITHSFRSLPMLGIVLLRYAKLLKNITVENIFYGVFETLGPSHLIDDAIPNPKDRKAPLIDLSTFSAIESWTFGADTFVKTGSVKLIKDLTMQDINPILANTQGRDTTANEIRTLMKSLDHISDYIITNRGKKIYETNEFQNVFRSLEFLTKDNQDILPPLKPLLNKIEDKLNIFRDDMHNWEASVKWCIQHNLIQQAITQLQEGIISNLCDEYKLSFLNHEDREIVSSAFNILELNINEDEWKKEIRSRKDKIKEIMTSYFVKEYVKNFARLKNLRNDINHCGYLINSKSNGKSFKQEIEDLFNYYIEKKHLIKKKPVMINLSNHPTENWTDIQKNEALKECEDIIDIPFPQIDPTCSSDMIGELAISYIEKIKTYQPCIVHIMGEMTFTYNIVKNLKEVGIKCIASTTDRLSDINNDVKTSIFKFIGFREY